MRYAIFSALSWLVSVVWFMFRLFVCLLLFRLVLLLLLLVFFFVSFWFLVSTDVKFCFSFECSTALALCKCYAVRVLFSYLCFKEWHSKQQLKRNDGTKRHISVYKNKRKTDSIQSNSIRKPTTPISNK